MENNTQFETPYWRLPVVLNYAGVSRSTWLNLIKKGLAPAPRQFPGTRAVVWPADEVRDFMRGLEKTGAQ